ncbi:hypothetical protein BOTNAR_0001g00400 [Botryotinia narcissicola]|uniref:Uncharacterized protein n=1 Tax=Botryotinia narcissicola TaxID=278944 RepID=A0A4Z1J9G2_9HELO|nr:hypothetical protein BOTNAR_0001g00400 [Botryotinia narcissicola]
MVQLIVTGPMPERIERARALQRKLLELILTARIGLLKLIPTPRESSISFKWRFTSHEYNGFPSESDEINKFHPLPQKMTVKWSLEDINKCDKAIYGDFIIITASSQSHRWTKQDIQEHMKCRLHDFIESSLGRPLKSRPHWINTGALTVLIREYEASQNKISTKACKPKAQVSISEMPLSAIIPFHENKVEILASEEAQCNKAPTSVISGRFDEGHGTSDLKLLCDQAWSHLENQVNFCNPAERPDSTSMLQQEISNTREKDEKDVSAARLEGEKIAEENILRLWSSAKERGRMPPICADESRSHLSKAGALHSPPATNPTDPVDHATTSSNDLHPTVATFDSQDFRQGTAITNVSVQIPPATNVFHESFLDRIFGPINCTLNIVPPSHILNPVKWTRFFTINLDTQPYIFPP